MILHTHRFGPHSKGDDTRPADEILRLRERYDPLKIQTERLTPDERRKIESEVEEYILQAFTRAQADPFPQVESL